MSLQDAINRTQYTSFLLTSSGRTQEGEELRKIANYLRQFDELKSACQQWADNPITGNEWRIRDILSRSNSDELTGFYSKLAADQISDDGIPKFTAPQMLDYFS